MPYMRDFLIFGCRISGFECMIFFRRFRILGIMLTEEAAIQGEEGLKSQMN